MSSEVQERKEMSLRAFKPYPKYKDSGVDWLGKIPAHWEVKRLRFVSCLNPSKSEIPVSEKSLEVSFLPMDYIGENGTLRLEEVRSLENVYQGFTYFRNGDVIIAKITPCFENGKGALAWGLSNGIGFGTTELHVIRPKGSLDQRFLWYLSVSAPFRLIGEFEMKGAAGQKRVPEDFIRDFRAPYLPVEEQRLVASFLDRETAKIDALISKRERLIELLQEKRTALISQAVSKGLDPNVPLKDSGIDWLGEIPIHWEVCHLRRVVLKFVDYRGKTPDKVPIGIPLITAKNIKNQQVDFSLSEEFIGENEYDAWMVRGLPEVGDVLITTEAPLGESAQIVDPNIALAQRIILLKANKQRIINDYLKYHFACDSGKSELLIKATGSTALGIKASHLKETLITVPPIDEQEAIVEYIKRQTSSIDMLMAKIREAIDHLKEYRTALISTAVTGKIDVRGETT